MLNLQEEEESGEELSDNSDFDASDDDMLKVLLEEEEEDNPLLEEEEEEEEDDIDTPEIEFRNAGFDAAQILNAADDKTVSQQGLNDTGIKLILEANKISIDGDYKDRLERLKMLVKKELFSMYDENTEASKFYYPDRYEPEQILNASKGKSAGSDGLNVDDIKKILKTNGQPEDGLREELEKRLRAILPSEDELLASEELRASDDSDESSSDEYDSLSGGLDALVEMASNMPDDDVDMQERDHIARDITGRRGFGLQHTPGDLSMMLAEMSDDWATSEDELNFAEESDSELKSSSGVDFAESSAVDSIDIAASSTSSGVDFAESSATSGPDFAESSSAETDDESLISSNALSFAESSATDGAVIPSSDAMEFAESSDAVSEKNSSGLDFAESSDYD